MTEREVVREHLARMLWGYIGRDLEWDYAMNHDRRRARDAADAVLDLLTRNQEAMRERCACEAEHTGSFNSERIRALPVQIVVEP